jgi:hypothetical protein
MTSSPTDLPATDLLQTGLLQTGLLQTGRRVIGREAEALALLAGALDDGFARAVNLILDAKGRVIVSGMGKSGHISSTPPRRAMATLAWWPRATWCCACRTVARHRNSRTFWPIRGASAFR